MKSIFPEPISNLPEADIPLTGIKAFLSQAENHQVLFMEFAEDVDLPEHSHAAQVGIVIRGKIDLTVNDQLNTYQKGDVYYIPSGTKHSGKIHAGYADVTFFDEPARYRQKDVTV
jgi:quercetin dioxygenase-like cupin family protein